MWQWNYKSSSLPFLGQYLISANSITFLRIAALQPVYLQAGTKLKIDQEGGGGSGAGGKAESLVAFAKRVNRGRALSKSGGPGGKGGKGAGMMAELGLKLAGGGGGGSPVQSQLALKLAKRRADAEAKADKS
jgi:hypothetical protein